MKFTLIMLFQLIGIHQAFSQVDTEAIRDSLVNEGKKLFRSEYASWYGTDVFMQEFKGDKKNIKGYFSYPENEDEVCIFFSNDEIPKIFGTVIFSKDNKVTYDSAGRAFTEKEKDIYLLRKVAFEEIERDTAFFTTYRGTSLNLIPLIENEERKVYILTGTSKQNTVIFGNDYLIKFDKQNKIISKKKLHQNIIPVGYGDKEEKNTVGAIHSHLPETGEFITATDICTLMLYEEYAKWESHTVVSEHYISIWNCKSNSLIIIPSGR